MTHERRAMRHTESWRDSKRRFVVTMALANLVLLGAITIRLFFQYPAVAPVPAAVSTTESTPEAKPGRNGKSVKKHT